MTNVLFHVEICHILDPKFPRVLTPPFLNCIICFKLLPVTLPVMLPDMKFPLLSNFLEVLNS